MINECRPKFFPACKTCDAATKYLSRAREQETQNGLVTQITALCTDIRKKGQEHAGTAFMTIRAIDADGEEGASRPVIIDERGTHAVYCAGSLE